MVNIFVQRALQKKKKLKEINLIGMPKILILFEGQPKSMGGEKPKGKSKDNQAKTLTRLDHKPHRSSLKNKMFNNKMNNKGHANDVGVVNERKKIQGNTFIKHRNAQKWASEKRDLMNELF